MGRRRVREGSSFLKKRSKRLLDGCRGSIRRRVPGRKRFLVFFQKRTPLVISPARAGAPAILRRAVATLRQTVVVLPGSRECLGEPQSHAGRESAEARVRQGITRCVPSGASMVLQTIQCAVTYVPGLECYPAPNLGSIETARSGITYKSAFPVHPPSGARAYWHAREPSAHPIRVPRRYGIASSPAQSVHWSN